MELITTGAVALMLGVSPERVRQFVAAGRLKAVRRGKQGIRGVRLFDPNDVAAFIAARAAYVPRRRNAMEQLTRLKAQRQEMAHE